MVSIHREEMTLPEIRKFSRWWVHLAYDNHFILHALTEVADYFIQIGQADIGFKLDKLGTRCDLTADEILAEAMELLKE